MVGEGQTAFDADDASLGIQRTALAGLEGTMRVGLGSSGEFTMPNGLQSAQLTKSSYDFMTAEGLLPRDPSTFFSLTILSPSSVSLVVIDSASKQQVSVTSLASPIKVRISIKRDMVGGGANWQNGASCAHYIGAQSGGASSLSFDGCTTFQLTEQFVECDCTHLTEFVAAIDPSIQSCGDGIIQAGEDCDDGNTNFKDGCSPSCQIEPGAQCWRTGTAPMERSECCAPCDAGSYRLGCTLMSDTGADGSCALCPVNTYKAVRGNWDTQCADCPAGELSGTGATTCATEAPCAAGSYRPQEGASCRACLTGTYKEAEGDATEQCKPYGTCALGSQLMGHTTSLPGTCEPCPPSTYKDTIGIWSTRCTPCPTGSSSTTRGNDQRDSCKCGAGYEQSQADPPAFCQDVNECLDTPCDPSVDCINKPGTYECVSTVCGDGFTVQEEACDDKNLVNAGDRCALFRLVHRCCQCPALALGTLSHKPRRPTDTPLSRASIASHDPTCPCVLFPCHSAPPPHRRMQQHMHDRGQLAVRHAHRRRSVGVLV
jgi:cysteine-rich repeat protein